MSGTPCRTQTYDPQIRNLLLYSTELKEHKNTTEAVSSSVYPPALWEPF